MIAVCAIVILFKITIEKIKHDPESASQIQFRFFIGVSLSEFIPIILIVYGFANMQTVTDVETLYLPGLIIIIAIAIATFFIFLQRAVDIRNEQTKKAVQTFSLLSFAVMNAIPIVSLIGLFMMVP